MSIKGYYDSTVIDAIINEDTRPSPPKEEEPAPKPAKAYKFKKAGLGKKFSDLFWKPTIIPDIPVATFKDSDWSAAALLQVPKVDKNWVWNKEVTERLALAMYCGDTTLLYGLQGTGKSCTLIQWGALCNIPVWRQSCNAETRETHFTGSPSPVYNAAGQMTIQQEPTVLTDSLREGGIFIEDEAFRHSSALVLQSLREKATRTLTLHDAPGLTSADRKLVAPVGKWWYGMTDNTKGGGDETGIFDAEVQDASTLDRIDVSIRVPYLEKSEEIKMLKKHTKVPASTITKMVSFANLVRNSFEQNTMLSTISVRGLLAWTEKTEMTGSKRLALQMSWYDKLSVDDQATAKDIYHQVFAEDLTCLS
jgi:cobaltochelatase CobS